jgi:hypothetical protein
MLNSASGTLVKHINKKNYLKTCIFNILKMWKIVFININFIFYFSFDMLNKCTEYIV